MIDKTRLENRLLRLKRERENEIDRHEIVTDKPMKASISGRINRLTIMIETVEDMLRLKAAPIELLNQQPLKNDLGEDIKMPFEGAPTYPELLVPVKVSFETPEKKDNKRVASVRQFGDPVVPKPKKKKEVKTHAGYVRPPKK